MTSDNEREGIEHAIHGFPGVKQVGGKIVEPKGVTIMDKGGVVDQKAAVGRMEKGVEILDSRHGGKGK
jgi:hypothetical protein